jgi:hypothetical protein
MVFVVGILVMKIYKTLIVLYRPNPNFLRPNKPLKNNERVLDWLIKFTRIKDYREMASNLKLLRYRKLSLTAVLLKNNRISPLTECRCLESHYLLT